MRLSGAANVLIMPVIHSAQISTQLIQSLGGATVIGPIPGLNRAVICPLSALLEDPADGDRLRS
jgi:malate dehydrogenase (oxaloacetate-decarboxylating)(NADP+)